MVAYIQDELLENTPRLVLRQADMIAKIAISHMHCICNKYSNYVLFRNKAEITQHMT